MWATSRGKQKEEILSAQSKAARHLMTKEGNRRTFGLPRWIDTRLERRPPTPPENTRAEVRRRRFTAFGGCLAWEVGDRGLKIEAGPGFVCRTPSLFKGGGGCLWCVGGRLLAAGLALQTTAFPSVGARPSARQTTPSPESPSQFGLSTETCRPSKGKGKVGVWVRARRPERASSIGAINRMSSGICRHKHRQGLFPSHEYVRHLVG
jgi:hypothetical protein